MDEVLRLALDGEITPLPRQEGKLTDVAKRPAGSDSLAH
jgi:hypothetical protein